MLRAMRGATQTWVIKLLLIFLVVSFAIWGVGDMFRGNPQQRLVACIGGIYVPFKFLFGSSAAICTGHQITVQTLQDEFERSFEMNRQKLGPDFTQKAALQMGYLDRTLSELIDRVLFDRIVKESELSFDDAFILREITAMPGLRTPEGKFDTEAFRGAVRKLRMTEQEFVDYTRDSVQRNLTLTTLAGVAALPKIGADQILVAHGQERQIQALRLAHESLPVPPGPSDEELNTYYTAHGAQFIAPEYRSISILEIVLEDIGKNTVISDQDLAAAFEKRRDEFALPERRDLLQILVPDEAKAKAIAAEAKAGKDLKKVAATQRLNPIVLEDQTEQNILPSLYTNVFTAETGAIIGPVNTEFGWHVLQLTRIQPATQQVLAEVKDGLRAKMQRERAAEDVQNLANKVDDDLAGGKSLKEISETYNFKLSNFPELDAGGNTADGKNAGMPKPDMTLKNAFGLNEGESSSLLDDRKGNYFVVHVDKIMPSHVRELAAVKDKVVAAWHADRQTQAAAAEAAKLADLWRQDATAYDTLLKKRGVSPLTAGPVSLLTGFDKTLPRTMQKDVFALKPGQVVTGADSEAHYLVRLAGYKEFDPAKNPGAQTVLKSKLSNVWREIMMEQYEVALQKEMATHVNKDLIDELKDAQAARE